MENINVWLGVGGAVLTVLGWLFRLEASVRNNTQRHDDHVRDNEKQHATHVKRYEDMRADIAYIRNRIDQLFDGRSRG